MRKSCRAAHLPCPGSVICTGTLSAFSKKKAGTGRVGGGLRPTHTKKVGSGASASVCTRLRSRDLWQTPLQYRSSSTDTRSSVTSIYGGAGSAAWEGGMTAAAVAARREVSRRLSRISRESAGRAARAHGAAEGEACVSRVSLLRCADGAGACPTFFPGEHFVPTLVDKQGRMLQCTQMPSTLRYTSATGFIK